MPLGPRGGLAGLAAALLEAAHPGAANAVLFGDEGGQQAGVSVGQDALTQIHRVGLHGDPPGRRSPSFLPDSLPWR